MLLSVDGLNPTAITMLGPSGAPTFYRLMAEGASTLNARTAVERTQTLPNHSSMASGRKVDLPGGHGVTFNEDPGTTIHDAAGQYVVSVFDLVHDRGGSTALFAGKEKFAFYDRSWAATTGAPDTTGPDNGRDKIDSYLRASSSATTSEAGRRTCRGAEGLHVHPLPRDRHGRPCERLAVAGVPGGGARRGYADQAHPGHGRGHPCARRAAQS